MANTANLDLVISLKDQASKGLGGISKSVGSLGVAMGTFVGGAALAGVQALGSAVSGFFGDAIQESRDAAKGLAQTQAVIKSTGGAAGVTADQIVELAGSLSHTTLFTDDAIQAQQNLLLTFTNVRNAAGEGNDIFTQSSKIALDLAQAMGTDAAGGAIQLGKALNDPVKGISALSRVGVTFTDQQKAQIKTMQASGDMIGAQKIILAELNKEFGGSAEAAAKADGGFHLFQQRMDDVKQSIGDRLQPALQTLMGFMSGPGMDAVEKFAGVLADELSTSITWLIDVGLPKAVIAFQGLSKGWNDAISGFTSGDFSSLKIDLSGIFGEGGATFITDTLQDIRQGWGLARDAALTFIEAVQGDWVNTSGILPLHQAVGDFGLVVHDVFGWLTTTGLPQLQAAFEAALPGNVELIHALTQALSDLGGQSTTTTTELTTSLSAWTTPLAGPALAINTLAATFAAFGKSIHDDAVIVGQQFSNLGSTIQSTINSINVTLTGWENTIKTVFTSILASITGPALVAWSTLYNAVQTANNNVVTALAGIETAVSTMASTVGTKINEAVTFIGGLPALATGALGNLGSTLVSAGSSLVQGLIDGINSKIETVKSTLASLTKLIPTWKGPAATDAALLFDSGKLIIQGLLDGFGAMTPAIKDKLTSITSMISGVFDAGSKGVDFFGKLLGFKTPSAGNIDAFVATTKALVQGLGTAAQAFKAKWLEQAGVFMDAASKGLGVLSAGIDGLNKLRTFKAPSVAAVNAFTDTVMLLVQSLGSAAQVFADDWLSHAQLFFDTTGKGLAILGSGVEGLTKLRDFKAPSLTAITAFSDTAILVVQTLGTAAQAFKEKWLSQASIFFDAAVKGLGVIGSGIEGLEKLRTFRAPAMAAVASFGDTLVFVVQTMNDIAKFFKAGDLEKTSVAAEAIGKIIAPITSAIEALSSVKNYKGIAAAAFRLLAQDIDGVIQTMVIIASHVSAEGVAAAAAFGDAVGSVMDGLKSTIDTFTSLNKYKGVAPAAIKLLISDLYGVIGTLQGFFASAGGAMQDAGDWESSMSSVAGAVQSGVDALNSIGAVKDVGGGIQAFAEGLTQLGAAFSTAFVTLMDTVLLPWQDATREFFGGAGFGFIGAVSAGVMSAAGGLALAAGNAGGAAGASLVSSLSSAAGGVGTVVGSINAALGSIERNITITITTVHREGTAP